MTVPTRGGAPRSRRLPAPPGDATAADAPGATAPRPSAVPPSAAVAGPRGPRRYWIGVVARDHVALGVAGGFTQLNHGKAGALERMRAGDGFAFYSPRETHPDGPPVQAFTAIGRIRDGRVYQADAGGGFRPFRLDVAYLPAHDAPIRPLLAALSFIRSKEHWGAAFRFGIVGIPEADFARVAAAMGRDFAVDFALDFAVDPATEGRAPAWAAPRST